MKYETFNGKIFYNGMPLKYLIAEEVKMKIQKRKSENKKASDKSYNERLKENQKSFFSRLTEKEKVYLSGRY